MCEVILRLVFVHDENLGVCKIRRNKEMGVVFVKKKHNKKMYQNKFVFRLYDYYSVNILKLLSVNEDCTMLYTKSITGGRGLKLNLFSTTLYMIELDLGFDI